MNRSMLPVLVVVACGLSQGCMLHNNRIVGSSTQQNSDWYGELGVTGHRNRVEVKSPSDLTKLSILGDGNVVYVQPRVTLGKVEVWGANNKIYVPARLIIRSNLVGQGSEIIRLAPGQYVNLKGVVPKIEGTPQPEAAGWDRYGRGASPAMPERYVYTAPRDGAGGSYALTPAYTNETGTGVYEADAGSPAMPDSYRYSETDSQRYNGYTLQPTYDSNIGTGDYSGQPQTDYANRMSGSSGSAVVEATPQRPATTYTTEPTASGAYRYDATPQLQPVGNYTTAPPDPAGTPVSGNTTTSSGTSSYTTYDAASYTTPPSAPAINQPISTGGSYQATPTPPARYGQPSGSSMASPDPPGTYSGSDYSGLGTTSGNIQPIQQSPGTSFNTGGTSYNTSTGGVHFDTGTGTYTPTTTYQQGTSYPAGGNYAGQPMVNAPATTSSGLIAPQDYRGKPGSGIGTYVTPDGYQIQTQSGVVTSTGTSAPQMAQPAPSDKPVVVEPYPY